jgi:4-amino-4-deoxy-L-arabinose transferase-like glycosyltransferase
MIFYEYKKLFFISIILKIFIILILIKYDIRVGDSASYLNNALNIINHNIYGDDDLNPSLYRPPLYSFFLALCIGLFGNKIFIFQVFQNILFFVSVFLLIKVVKKLNLNFSKPLFIFAIFSPFETIYSGAILSENLASFFIILTIYFLICSQGYRKYIFSGISMGLLCLIKDTYILLPFMILFFFFFSDEYNKKFFFINLIFLILFFLATILPWIVRNNYISDKFVLISNGRLGYSLWIGTWAQDGKWTIKNNNGIPEFPKKAFKDNTEKNLLIEGYKKGIDKIDDDFKRIAIERIKSDPVGTLKTYIIRFPNLWLGTRTDIFLFNNELIMSKGKSWYIIKTLFYLINFILVISGFLGIYILLKKNFKKHFLIALPILYTSVIYIPLNSFENRYTQPVLLLMLFFSSYFFLNCFMNLKKNNLK